MTKTKITYVCQQCGSVHMRWAGRCDDCEAWNSIVEEAIVQSGTHARPAIVEGAKPLSITTEGRTPPPRFSTFVGECDRSLGGGIVPGALMLIGGDPGIGKSTIMLQISYNLAKNHGPVLYVSGEESFDQTRMRAERLGAMHDNLILFTETSIDAIRKQIASGDFQFAVIDSIQSVYSSQIPSVPGSIAQVRECANEFLRLAKGHTIPIFLVGHVTKDGALAGPRLLEHLVDTVLYFEGEGKQSLRILRAVKNRFGSTNEIGVFEMTGEGLQEVPNPSALFVSERPHGVSGSVVTPSIEGTRPLLVEVQALVSDSPLSSPRRTVTGINPNRLSLILAVLEKRAELPFSDKDVFVNVAGGIRLEEPAADLAIAAALVSSLRNIPVADNATTFGEIGLAGEVRAVELARRRVAEAAKFGFEHCALPRSCMSDLDASQALNLHPITSVTEALEYMLEN